jgi:hypothetical protein
MSASRCLDVARERRSDRRVRRYTRAELVATLEEEIRVREAWVEGGWINPSDAPDKLRAVLEVLRGPGLASA